MISGTAPPKLMRESTKVNQRLSMNIWFAWERRKDVAIQNDLTPRPAWLCQESRRP